MSKALTTFALVAVFTALLMALGLAVARHGYPYGAIGVKRLDDIADAGTFIPLAAVYFFSALLMMILPIGGIGEHDAGGAAQLAGPVCRGHRRCPSHRQRASPQRPAQEPVLRHLRGSDAGLPVLVVRDLTGTGPAPALQGNTRRLSPARVIFYREAN